MYKSTKISLLVLLFLSIAYTPAFASKEFIGSVKSLEVVKRNANYDSSYEGGIGFVNAVGFIGESYITNMKGNKVIQGTPLYEYVLPFWEGYVQGYKDYTKTSKIVLDDTRMEFNMYRKLAAPGAVSVSALDNYTDKYIEALKNYETDKSMINVKYEDVREAVYRPPFEGMITKVYETNGVASGGYVIEYTQLNPIGINVKMDRSEAKKLSDKPVKIYIPGENKPQGILYGRTLLTDEGVTFITINYPSAIVNDPELKLKVQKKYRIVLNFDLMFNGIPGSTLGVGKEAILKDSKGFFVWKIDGEHDLNIYKGMNNIFTAGKVYVIPDDLFVSFAGDRNIQALKDKGSLKVHDMVLVDPPKDYKKGEKLFFPMNRYNLMPGEKVKVVIGE